MRRGRATKASAPPRPPTPPTPPAPPAPPFLQVSIAIVGKYNRGTDAYLSILRALGHAAIHANRRLDYRWVDSEHLQDEATPEARPPPARPCGRASPGIAASLSDKGSRGGGRR